MSLALLLDTETTSLVEPEVIELAYARLIAPHELDTEVQCQRFRPSKPITYGAMATHHIIDEDLVDCPPWPGFEVIEDDVGYLIGHNVDFDWKAIGSPALKRICTLALARYLLPALESHSLSVLIYALHPTPATARGMVRDAHSAVTDVSNALYLLGAFIAALERQGRDIADWESLWQISEVARVPTIMPFGKHKGVAISDVPGDYKQWLLRQPDVDPYLVRALRA